MIAINFPRLAPDSDTSASSGHGSAPVFDRAAALLGYGGDVALLSELVKIFDSNLGSRIDDLLSAIARNDLPNVMSLAHSLKGSSAFVYAMRLSALCIEIEKAARSCSSEDVAALGARLPEEAKAFRKAIAGR